MFHHVERFRLREGVLLADVRVGFDALAALVETLPGVEHFAVTENLVEPHGGWAMVLFSAFTDRRAADIFLRHPELQHIWAEHLDHVVAAREVVARGESAI
jgi:hypothetical protein